MTTTTTTTTSGQLTSVTKLQDLLHSVFPTDQLVHAFGYGSGVFSQGINNSNNNNNNNDPPPPPPPGMIDMILVVRDAQAWHQANQAMNADHYAMWLRTMDPQGMCAASLQRAFRGGGGGRGRQDGKVFFHVIDDPIPLKYGVIQTQDLVQDLTGWDSLYVAGRLHKPTLAIPIETSIQEKEELMEAQHYNLQAAVAAALLLSPLSIGNLPWLQVYSQIAALSYTGDFRMAVGGEDPHKIQKLVHTPGQLERFHALYRDGDPKTASGTSVLRALEEMGLLSIQEEGLQWDPLNVSSRTQLIQRLPTMVKKSLLVPSTTTSRLGGSNPVDNHLVVQQATLSSTLASIVAPAARSQSFKGLFTFGLRKSMLYASAKLSKGLLRKRLTVKT
jgi:mitochondrial translocator assembly and maintenance protein 41